MVFIKVNAQVSIERIDSATFFVLNIYEKQNNKSVILDSIILPTIFHTDYTYYCTKDSLIYISCRAFGQPPEPSIQEFAYYIYAYKFDENKKVVLTGEYAIRGIEHKELFKKGLRIAVTDKGLQLSFTQGKFALLVFSFDELNLKTLSKELSKIDKL